MSNAHFTSQFEGHAMALSVVGLVLFGRSPNWNDEAGLQKLSDAIVVTDNSWISALMNDSVAITKGMALLDKMGTEEAKLQFMDVVGRTAAAFLEEHGGTRGLDAYRVDIIKCAQDGVIEALDAHGDEAKARFDESQSTKPKDNDFKLVVLDPSKDIGEQLKASGMPSQLADLLTGAMERSGGKSLDS